MWVGNSQKIVKQITLGKHQKIWTKRSIPDHFRRNYGVPFPFGPSTVPLCNGTLTDYEQAGGQVWLSKNKNSSETSEPTTNHFFK